ncbi:SpaA isopeptide-forming pilin-related protein [Lentzea sp. NPDC004782]|uniref:MSCRAMM family protein n=1 Tax=Lentzea sp. NPDC004782 TaxID=3154458 RepID=UPI0033B3AB98
MGWKRLAAVAVVSGLALLTAPTTATAVGDPGYGHKASGLQRNATPGSEWHGTYKWQGKHVWCVQYALPAPDSKVDYKEGDELLTKAGKKLDPAIAANISYLLLRYSTTTSDDEAAALAHLLHTWTSPVDGVVNLDATDARFLAYDASFYAAQLGQPVMDTVARMKADAEANRGPWTLSAAAPKEPLIIGAESTWTVSLLKQNNKGVPNAPIEFTLNDAALVDGSAGGKVKTDADGNPASIKVIPTGPKPSITVNADSPADKPVVHQPISTDNMQRMVTTGGEKKLNANASGQAKTAPGAVKITKIDSETKKAIAGVALRVTAKDQTSAAKKQDDSDLVGTDGKPIVLQTGADGTVEVPNLRTPQEICLVEVAAPKGYEEFFDPKSPPAACGTVAAGQTLALELVNKPNKPVVPSTIPAGQEGNTPVATASFDTQLRPGLMLAVGGLVLLGAALAGFLVWRRQ